MHWKTELTAWWTGVLESLPSLIGGIVRIALYLVVALVLIKFSRRVIQRVFAHFRESRHVPVADGRINTIMTLTLSAVRFLIVVLAAAGIAGVLGLTTTLVSLLSAAGIGGLIIGFGAQDLIKDCISGVFMLMDDEIAVGDFVQIDSLSGTVEAIYLRVTHLKAFDGSLHILPNGSISKITNLSRSPSLAIVDLPISYESDIDAVTGVILDEANAWANEHADLVVEPPKVLGVTALADNNVTVRLICRVQPLQHWEAERTLRRRMLERYMREGIEVPYPRAVVMPPHEEGKPYARRGI